MQYSTTRLASSNAAYSSFDRSTEEVVLVSDESDKTVVDPTAEISNLQSLLLSNEEVATYDEFLNDIHQILNTHCPMDLFMTYRNQHKHIIERITHDDQRISLFYSSGRGLGDKVVSAVTTFYTAILSNRAFQIVFQTRRSVHHQNKAGGGLQSSSSIHSAPNSYSFLDVYRSPWIDLPLNGNNTLTEDDKANRTIISFFPFRQVAKHYSYDYYLTTNFTAEHTNDRLLHWMVTKGSLHSLLENPYHKHWFEQHKLHSGNAFGCAMQFLFQPTKETFEYGGTSMAKLWKLFRRKNPKILKIGIQIRVGDHTSFEENKIQSDEWVEDIVSPFLSCAMQIEAFNYIDDDIKRAMWFVSSDNNAVLNHISTKYPQRTIHLPSPTLEHTADGSKAGIQSAVQDHILLGLQDYVIVYDLTSFGRSGALRQLEYGGNHMYHIKRGTGTAKDPHLSTYHNEKPKCGPLDYARWEQYSTEWIGI